MTLPDASIGALLTLPPPKIGDGALLARLRSGWGLDGVLHRLTSERDLNHRLDTAAGRYTVKLANPAEPQAMTDFQSGALVHLASADPGLPVPRLLPTQSGAPWINLEQGRLRVLTWLDGTPLATAPRSLAQAKGVGAILARMTRALSGYSHPGADHVLLWDIRQTPSLAALIPGLSDPALRAEVQAFVADFTARVAPLLPALPTQVCHADFNPHNLLVAADDPDQIAGIIDFGDMVATQRICDVAVAAAYQTDPDAPIAFLQAFIAGYTGTLPLTRTEVALLYDLISARMIATLAITGWRAARYPDNATYILRNAPSARAGLDALRAIGRCAVTAALLQAAQIKEAE